MGVYPESFLSPIRRDVGLIVERIERAAPTGDAVLKQNDATTKRYRVASDQASAEKHGRSKEKAAEGSH
jgi:NADH-quinone oxidoreductase subunit M